MGAGDEEEPPDPQLSEEPPPDLRGVTFGEQALFDAYKEALKGALDAADKTADTILTATFSIATAYGALIGLVSPKDQQGPILLGLPFVFFAFAALAAMLARTRRVPVKVQNRVDDVTSAISNTVKWKRIFAGAALAAIATAMGVAAWVVVKAYAAPSLPQPAPVTIVLTKDGVRALRATCPAAGVKLRADLSDSALAEDFVEARLAAGVCGKGPRTVKLAKEDIAAVLPR